MVIAQAAAFAGYDVVSVCDRNEGRLNDAVRDLDVPGYKGWSEFLEHPCDAVLLANDFDDHTRYAVEALERGRHVLSETTACSTPAEAVRLVETVERTGMTYGLAENYPHKNHVITLRGLYRSGALGQLQYGEAEYTHGWSDTYIQQLQSPPDHWRARISILSYSTHAIAPVMYVTDLRPVAVSGFVVPTDESAESARRAALGHGRAGVIMMRMDSGAVVKVLVGFLQGELQPETCWVRIHGSRGLGENVRTGDSRVVRTRVEPWASADDASAERLLPVHLPDDLDQGRRLDTERMLREFREAVLTGRAPYFDVYRAIDASLAGIYAVRSACAGAKLTPIPDLRFDSERNSARTDETTSLEGGRDPTGNMGEPRSDEAGPPR